MQTNAPRTTVSDFLAQKRIAVAGVSSKNSSHPAANLIYKRLKATGHDVFAVNPNMKSFEGDLCYPDLRSIPEGVDGVVIVTRPEVTEKIVHDCRDAGVPRVWMHQSLANGSSVSKAAVDYCRENGIGVIEGGCPMMVGDDIDFGHRCMRWMMSLAGSLPE
jgi:predicted CoA-binding protein